MNDLLHSLIDLVFPRFCVGCNQLGDQTFAGYICPDCWKLLNLLSPPICSICGAPLSSSTVMATSSLCGRCLQKEFAFDRARSVFIYDARNIIKEFILKMKYAGYRAIALEFGRIMAERVLMEFNPTDWDAIVPVPLHPKRQRTRGFNQSQVMALALRSKFKVPIMISELTRTRNTVPQQGSRRSRALNVQTAFRVTKPKEIRNKNLLILDDVMTTGATVNACAEVLKQSGALRVDVFTLCRVKWI